MCHIATLAELSYNFSAPNFSEGFTIKRDFKNWDTVTFK